MNSMSDHTRKPARVNLRLLFIDAEFLGVPDFYFFVCKPKIKNAFSTTCFVQNKNLFKFSCFIMKKENES